MSPFRRASPTPTRIAAAAAASASSGRVPRVDLSEVLAALSRALDLTEGQPQGHSARAAVVGLRLADEMGFAAPDR